MQYLGGKSRTRKKIAAFLEIDFEVWCGICGTGCCGNTDVGYRQGYHSITVTCPECSKRFSELEAKIEELQAEIEKTDN